MSTPARAHTCMLDPGVINLRRNMSPWDFRQSDFFSLCLYKSKHLGDDLSRIPDTILATNPYLECECLLQFRLETSPNLVCDGTERTKGQENAAYPEVKLGLLSNRENNKVVMDMIRSHVVYSFWLSHEICQIGSKVK